MYISAEDTALLLALMLNRSGKTRGRISDATLRTLSKRRSLKAAFRTNVVDWAEEFGVILYPLDRGGYGMLSASSMEGAPPLRAGQFVKTEMNSLKRSQPLDYDALYAELGLEFEDSED